MHMVPAKMMQARMAQAVANETSVASHSLPQGQAVDERDYQSFCDTLGSSARGRAFLHEYARRNRHADTTEVLAALDRLEQTARKQAASPEAERIRQDLRALLDTIRSARPQIDSSPGAIRAATLSALIEFVQARIEGLLAPGPLAALTEVPQPEQPELPIPRPDTAAPRSIALVQRVIETKSEQKSAEPPQVSEFIPMIDFVDGLPKVQERAGGMTPAAQTTETAAPEMTLDIPLVARIAEADVTARAPAEDVAQDSAQDVVQAADDVTAQTSAEAVAGSSAETLSDAEPHTTAATISAVGATEYYRSVAPELAPPSLTTDRANRPAADAPATTATPAMNPLAAIMALSEDERIALFT